jgi:ribosomal protein S18 acetylase RimI-like enzyme
VEPLLDDLSDAALAAANYADLYEWVVYLGRSPAADFRQEPPLTWMLSGVPISFLNQVWVEPCAADELDRAVTDALAYFQSHHVSHVGWWPLPGVDRAQLGQQLEAHGLVYDPGGPGMAADLLALDETIAPPAGLTIEPVTDEDALRGWNHALSVGMGAPGLEPPSYELYGGLGFDLPLRSYLGCLHGEPVACSQLFLGAGVAGIYCVATLPEARRQGIGASLTLAAMCDARALGYRHAVLQASEMGHPVYVGLGFREVCRMSHWEWHDTPQ